jgi:hypothetical protein
MSETVPSRNRSHRKGTSCRQAGSARVVLGFEGLVDGIANHSKIGIGGSLTAPPLPHHRTCGSAYGGSAGWATGRQSISESQASRSKHWAVHT